MSGLSLLRRARSLASPPLLLRAPSAPSALRAPLLARGLAYCPTTKAQVPKHKVYPQWRDTPRQHELWQPNKWLGAYFKMREGDETAAKNQAKLRGKRSNTRARFIVQTQEQTEMAARNAVDEWRKMEWNPGDFLEVEHSPKVGDQSDRVVGVLIGMYRRGLGSSFRLLCYVDGCAVEYLFQTYSPLLSSVTLRKATEQNRKKRKLYRLREVVSKLSFPKPTRVAKRVTETKTVTSGRKRGSGM